MEEEMVFPQPLDVVFATVASKPGKHQAAGRSDVSEHSWWHFLSVMAFKLTQPLGDVEEHPQGTLYHGDVQLCLLPRTNVLRFASCCSSNGIFQILLGLFIQQLFFLL